MQNLAKSTSQPIVHYDASTMPRSPEVPGVVSPLGVGIQPQAQDDFWVYLRLRAAGFTLKKARMTNSTGQWGEFFPMPWVKRNCFADCETCFQNGNYQPILLANCRDRPFKLEMHFQSDSNPNQWGKTTHDVKPDCAYPGQVECVG